MRGLLITCFSFFFMGALAQNIDVQHYHFKIELSDQSDAINGEAMITIKFLSETNQFKLDLAGLEDEKGMIAYEVTEDGKKLTATQSKDKLSITLASAAKKEDTRTIIIRYMGTPKDGLIISKNKFGDRTFFADNWPDRAHNWIPCNDRPDDKASFEFIVIAPKRVSVISNGKLLETKTISPGKVQTHWTEDTPSSTKIMVIGAAAFTVKQYPEKKWPVTAWVYPQDSTKGYKDFAPAVEVLNYYSDYIAPFPYTKLANVESTTIFGGMENASAIFYDEERITGEGKDEDLVAHEIAHQWFGDMASEKQFSHLWLSEGFATYLTDIFTERKYGRDSAAKRMQKEREQVIRFVEKNNMPVVDTVSSLMNLLNPNSYQKGGWVLHMLRKETGDSVFRKILQTYYNTYKGSNADSRDFEAIVEKVTNKNWKSFFDQWLYTPGIPTLHVQWKTDSSHLFVTVNQTGKNLYEFPLTIGYNLPNGQLVYKTLRIAKKTEAFEMPISAMPMNLLLDPLTDLLFKGTVSKE
jgi:aminopeptidase N